MSQDCLLIEVQQIMSLCIVTVEGTWRIYHTFETTVQSLLGCLFSNRPIMISPISKSLIRPCTIDTASVFRDSSPLIKFLSLLDLLLDFPMKNEQDCDALESLSKVLFDKALTKEYQRKSQHMIIQSRGSVPPVGKGFTAFALHHA
jgi:hypothetical protein